MHKKKSAFSFMHSVEALPQAGLNTRRENAPIQAHFHLHAVQTLGIVVVFLRNNLLALMLNSLMRSGVENLARHFAPLYLSSPTYNPTKKPYLKLPRKMQLLYHNLPEGWEWGIRGEG